MALLQEIQVPLLAVNDTTLSVVELPFDSGAKVKQGDVVLVLETSKTSYDVEAATDGYIQYSCEAGRDYTVGDLIAKIFSEASEAMAFSSNGHDAAALRPTQVPTRRQAPGAWIGEPLFSNEAKRLMATAGIGPQAFAGRDLVTGKDVREILEPTPAKPKPSAAQAAAPAQPIDSAKAVIKKLQSAKRREIEYLSDIQSTGLTSTINTNVDTEGIFLHLNTALAYLKDSLLPAIVYESARLLTDYPLLNAYFTGDAVAIYKEVSPGFAIDIDKGLKVLKVKDAGSKGIREIEKDILQLSGAYLDDAIQIEDLTDITFTITDLSAEGVASFRPLINKMNSAILGVSAIDEKLQRCTLSLTFDHRVTEGKYAAGFLRELQQRLESYKGDTTARYKDISCFKCYKTLAEDLGGTGFVRCITPEGKEGYVCQSCLKGF